MRGAATIGGTAMRRGAVSMGLGGLHRDPEEKRSPEQGDRSGVFGGLMRNVVGQGLASFLPGLLGRGPRDKPQKFSMDDLAKRLGTPNPSEKQIEIEKARIAEQNRDPSTGEKVAGIAVLGGKATATAAALGLTIKAANSFAKRLNNAATQDLRKFNSAIARLAGRRELFDMQQQVRRGKGVEASTKRLGELMMENDRESQRYAVLGENILNTLALIPAYLEKMVHLLADLANVDDLTDWLNKLFGGGKPDRGVVLETIDAYLKGKHGNDPRPANKRPNEGVRNMPNFWEPLGR